LISWFRSKLANKRQPPEPVRWPWLDPQARSYATDHLDTLESIYEAFDDAGAWPDPVDLQRKLRAGGRGATIAPPFCPQGR
jgi:hypothetical protein